MNKINLFFLIIFFNSFLEGSNILSAKNLIKCDNNAKLIDLGDNNYECVCNNGYYGNGYKCEKNDVNIRGSVNKVRTILTRNLQESETTPEATTPPPPPPDETTTTTTTTTTPPPDATTTPPPIIDDTPGEYCNVANPPEPTTNTINIILGYYSNWARHRANKPFTVNDINAGI